MLILSLLDEHTFLYNFSFSGTHHTPGAHQTGRSHLINLQRRWMTLYIIFLEAVILITALLSLNCVFSLHPSLAIYHSAISPGSVRRLPPPLLRPPPPPVGSDNSSVFPEVLPMPRTSISTPPSPAPTRSSLIQSTSFLESIPVTLTMDPKEWLNTGLEDEAGAVTVPNMGLERQGGDGTRRFRGFDVELRRKPGEGFGFVIASQDVENGKGKKSCLASIPLFNIAHFFKRVHLIIK